MEVRPVRRYGFPAYPSRLAVLSEPELLRRHVPPGWRRCAEVALAGAAFLAAGGVSLAGEKADPPGKAKAAIVAPIFEHGSGIAASGCVVVAPPVFLSEDEALGVIKAELAKSGVELSRDRVMVRDVTVVRHKQDNWAAGAVQLTELRDSARPLELDAMDPKRGIAVEYVSLEDSIFLIQPYTKASVVALYMKHAAQLLSDQVRGKAPRMNLGVFYDPVSSALVNRKEKDRKRAEADAERRAKAESKELLRQQVKDFADWLKAQGAI